MLNSTHSITRRPKKDTVIFTGNGDEINIYKCDFIETPESITFIGIKALEKAILDAAHGLKPGAVFTVDMPGDIDYEWSCDIAKEFTGAVLKVTQSANAEEEIFVQIVWETNNGDECFVQGTFSRFIGVKQSESAYAYAPAKKGSKTTKAVEKAVENLRAALKEAYGANFTFDVSGKGALIAASCHTFGTVFAQS